MQAKTIDKDFDMNDLLVRVEYDKDLLREILQIFTEDFPQTHLLLKDAVSRGDLSQIRCTAHTLQGMLASLSFGKASASAMRIERMAGQLAIEGMPAELERLERNAAFAQAGLQKAFRELAI
jgi:two-component system, sensor histidine kinase and response regulator